MYNHPMDNIFLIAQIILGVTLTACIVMQSRGAGLGSAWGGLGMAYHSKRGVEKLLFRFTIITATLFLIISLASAMVSA